VCVHIAGRYKNIHIHMYVYIYTQWFLPLHFFNMFAQIHDNSVFNHQSSLWYQSFVKGFSFKSWWVLCLFFHMLAQIHDDSVCWCTLCIYSVCVCVFSLFFFLLFAQIQNYSVLILQSSLRYQSFVRVFSSPSWWVLFLQVRTTSRR